MPISPDMLKRYPPYWRQLSHFVRFVLGNGQCRFCGAVHGCPHPVTGSRVVLTTAHLIDMRPEADRLDNLAGLCQRCHNRHDAAYRRANALKRRTGQGDLLTGAPA